MVETNMLISQEDRTCENLELLGFWLQPCDFSVHQNDLDASWILVGLTHPVFYHVRNPAFYYTWSWSLPCEWAIPKCWMGVLCSSTRGTPWCLPFQIVAELKCGWNHRCPVVKFPSDLMAQTSSWRATVPLITWWGSSDWDRVSPRKHPPITHCHE